MTKKKGCGLPIALSIAMIGILGVGCSSNLESVEKFGTTSAAVKTASNNIANDIYSSCLRIASKYAGNRRRFPNSRVIAKVKEEIKECDPQKKNVTIFKDSNAVLINYMVGLGQLASSDTVSFDNNLNRLEASLSGLTSLANIPSEQTSAGLKIARFIFNQLTLKFRKNEIKKALICADPEIEKYTNGLASIAQDYYINGVLAVEQNSINGYFTDLIPPPSQSRERVPAYLLNQNFVDETQEIQKRIQAGNAYISILKSTRDTHSQLKSQLDKKKLEGQDVVSLCNDLFAEDDQVDTADKARELTIDNVFSLRELREIEKILLEYDAKIQPRIQEIEIAYSSLDKH